jgi:hypothetical protein
VKAEADYLDELLVQVRTGRVLEGFYLPELQIVVLPDARPGVLVDPEPLGRRPARRRRPGAQRPRTVGPGGQQWPRCRSSSWLKYGLPQCSLPDFKFDGNQDVLSWYCLQLERLSGVWREFRVVPGRWGNGRDVFSLRVN